MQTSLAKQVSCSTLISDKAGRFWKKKLLLFRALLFSNSVPSSPTSSNGDLLYIPGVTCPGADVVSKGGTLLFPWDDFLLFGKRLIRIISVINAKARFRLGQVLQTEMIKRQVPFCSVNKVNTWLGWSGRGVDKSTLHQKVRKFWKVMIEVVKCTVESLHSTNILAYTRCPGGAFLFLFMC